MGWQFNQKIAAKADQFDIDVKRSFFPRRQHQDKPIVQNLSDKWYTYTLVVFLLR